MPYICLHCGKKFRYKVTQRTHKCTGKPEAATEDHRAALGMFFSGAPLSGAQYPTDANAPSNFSLQQMAIQNEHDDRVFRQSGQLDQEAGQLPVSPSAVLLPQETHQYSQTDSSTSAAFSLPREPNSPRSPPVGGGAFSAAVPPEIRQHLLKFRRAQGRRHLGNRLQHILERYEMQKVNNHKSLYCKRYRTKAQTRVRRFRIKYFSASKRN
jgi:hypothetical protein